MPHQSQRIWRELLIHVGLNNTEALRVHTDWLASDKYQFSLFLAERLKAGDPYVKQLIDETK